MAAVPPAILTAWLHPGSKESPASSAKNILHIADAITLKPALWVDAREPAEFAAGHVPEALNLSLTEWEQQLEHLVNRWDPNATVVVYCGGGGCLSGQQVASRLRAELGASNVVVLAGGWPAWLEWSRQQKPGEPAL